MPVTVEGICLPFDQDFTDLQKIYEDAPTWMVKYWQCPTTSEGIMYALTYYLSNNKKNYLYAARFNSRLLAAILINDQGGAWLMHSLCVRALNRGRGVGSRLLEEVIKKSRKAGRSIIIYDPENKLHDIRLHQTIGEYQRI